MALRDEILDLSRQATRGALSPWFADRFAGQVERGLFPSGEALEGIGAKLVGDLASYRDGAGIGTAVLGISGGVDSALTAALLKAAGWRVVGYTLPIEQNPEETERGAEACAALGLEHRHLDLSDSYRHMVGSLGGLDAALPASDASPHRTRRGNVRARLRMITLYDQAHREGGLVASTDNFSELGAGFWTLHGDVGDLAPVQGLIKSWEVPWLARAYGVPERIWRAKPTDGLGIGEGDEAQIGASYLEWDITIFALMEAVAGNAGAAPAALPGLLELGGDGRAAEVLDVVLTRLGRTWHKRVNPIRLDHPTADRYSALDTIDARLFRPAVLGADEALPQFSGALQERGGALARLLQREGLRLVTAESCTGGLLAACVAGARGSSSVLEGSFVTYGASLKTDALGVSAALLREHTPYHPEVARQMAAGALERAPRAHLALSVTGVAGPGPDQGKPPGLVHVAGARRGGKPVVEEHAFEGPPKAVLAAAILAALDLGTRLVEGEPG